MHKHLPCYTAIIYNKQISDRYSQCKYRLFNRYNRKSLSTLLQPIENKHIFNSRILIMYNVLSSRIENRNPIHFNVFS